MPSKLIVVPFKRLQQDQLTVFRQLKQIPTIYIALNKSARQTEQWLSKNKIVVSKYFFIDSLVQSEDDYLHVKPQNPDLLHFAIHTYLSEIPGEKYLVIDAISTLLIYNDETKIARFLKEMLHCKCQKNTKVIAFTPNSSEGELISTIYNFFDNCEVIEK